MSREILDCLKRKQDICIKNIIPSQNTAFMCTPALNNELNLLILATWVNALNPDLNDKMINPRLNDNLDMVSFKVARIQDMMTLVYKCLANMAPPYTSLFWVRNCKYDLRGLKTPPCTEGGHHFFWT